MTNGFALRQYGKHSGSYPDTYLAAQSRLGNRASRKIGNNTYLHRVDDDTIAIRLHQTDVVTFTLSTVSLDTGGWYTVTTKDRINSGLPGGWSVASDKGRWYLYRRADGERFAFRDGITINTDTGDVTDYIGNVQVRDDDAARRALRQKIEKYLKTTTPEEIVAAFTDAGGDCFLCRFGTDPAHVVSHVEEHYVMLTLTRRAVEAAGYHSPDVIVSMIFHDAQRGRIDPLYTRTMRKYLRKSIDDTVGVASV